MAASDAKSFKQDLVVSIRYRNDLPPPPMPPKLLDIDTGGLAQYLTTGYASSLAKREEPNIEVDAEGGMPIDMIGVPGYFLGDESAIMAPEIQPVLDPADHALLLTLDQLKSQGAKDNVSFLRKTQYMTASQMAKANDPMLARPSPRSRKTPDTKVAAVPLTRDDKENVKRQVQKAFDLAYPESIPYNPPEAKSNPITQQERDAWDNPVHPDNPRLKPVAFYPLIPDLDAATDIKSHYHALRFDKPPLPPLRGRRDDRIDVSLLYAGPNQALHSTWAAKKAAYDQDPDRYEDPGTEPFTWSLHIPKQPDTAPRIRQAFDDSNPNKDDPALINRLLEESINATPRLPFERVKVYPTNTQTDVDGHQVMAVSLVDADKLPSTSRFKKQGTAAYYYPIAERLRLRADRGNLGKMSHSQHAGAGADIDPGSDMADQLMVSFREPDIMEMKSRALFRGENDDTFKAEYEEIERMYEEAVRAQQILEEQGEVHEGAGDVSMAEVEAGEDAEVDAEGGARRERDDDAPTPPATNGAGKAVDDGDGEDADVDEDDEMQDG